MSAAGLSRLMKNGDVSPVDVVEAHLARIDALEPRLNSFITRLPERAMASARDAEREIRAGRYRGPLHGIPIGPKDLYHVKGVRNTAGSRIFHGFVPDSDSEVAAPFEAAGAVLIGNGAISVHLSRAHPSDTGLQALDELISLRCTSTLVFVEKDSNAVVKRLCAGNSGCYVKRVHRHERQPAMAHPGDAQAYRRDAAGT